MNFSVFGFRSACVGAGSARQLVKKDADSLARIRFAQLLRLGQTARRQTLRHLPSVRKRKQPAKNAGASHRPRPFGCFLLLSSGIWNLREILSGKTRRLIGKTAKQLAAKSATRFALCAKSERKRISKCKKGKARRENFKPPRPNNLPL